MEESDKYNNSNEIAIANQLVTFLIEDTLLGIPTTFLQEIIRMPSITEIPTSNDSVLGVSNLRGKLITIVDLRLRLQSPPQKHTRLTRILVLNFNNSLVGLLVDSVIEVIQYNPEQLNKTPDNIKKISRHLLRGVIQQEDALLLVLHEHEILPEIDMNDLTSMANSSRIQEQNMNELTTSQQVIALRIGKEEYAIDIHNVKEIIRFREITPIPNAPHYVLGVVSLRGLLLPIMDLKILFNIQENPITQTSQEKQTTLNKKHIDLRRIVVVDIDGQRTGFLVDSVSRVLKIHDNEISTPPSLVTNNGNNNLTGVAKLNNGKRIIMLLNTNMIINKKELKEIAESHTDSTNNTTNKEEVVTSSTSSEDIQLVCFKVENEEYAVDIMKVQEIIRLSDITSVPHSKKYMKGIINLRGVITPVVDMRTRFNYNDGHTSKNTRVVVIQVNNKPIGLIVDSVTEVLRTAKSNFESTPQGIEESQDKFIEQIGKLEQGTRIVALLNEELMFNEDLEEHSKNLPETTSTDDGMSPNELSKVS